MNKMNKAAVALAVVVAKAAAAPAQAWVQLTPGMTWANRAWGMHNGGGAEPIDGMDMVLVDYEIEPAEIVELKTKVAVVACYISAGTSEGWREDYAPNKEQWDEVALGQMSTWEEMWLDIRQPEKLLALMTPRFQRAKNIGCDAIEIDNMDCYETEDCYPLMGATQGSLKEEQRVYVTMLADLAHSLGMAIIQKNAVTLTTALSDTFDAVITENCQHWNECLGYSDYPLAKNKAHFAAEYLRQDSELAAPVGVCSYAANTYPQMMVKYCHSNWGRYLCKESETEWSACFQVSDRPSPVPAPAPEPAPTHAPAPAPGPQTWVRLTPGMTWANRAWGMHNGGGAEPVDGMDMVLVDYEIEPTEIVELKTKVAVVACYISAGTSEGWREDYAPNKEQWDEVALGQMLTWEEMWLDIRQPEKLLALMTPRFQRAKNIGCDAIEIDNMDCYETEDCYPLMGATQGSLKEEQRVYVTMLADLAHSLGMAIIQKNAVTLTTALSDTFDAVITENCQHWNECLGYSDYPLAKNKAHFAAEYLRQDSELAAPVGVCSYAANTYPQMMVKYCHSNWGRYLCKESETEWSACFQVSNRQSPVPAPAPEPAPEPKTGPEPESGPSPTPAPEPAPRPVPEPAPEEPLGDNEVRLACPEAELITRTVTSTRAKLSEKMGASKTTCMMFEPSTATGRIRIKFIDRKLDIAEGDVVRVYRVDGLDWSRGVATGAELLAELPGYDTSTAVAITNEYRGSSVLLVYEASAATQRKLFAKIFAR